jgi:hypothetical protein
MKAFSAHGPAPMPGSAGLAPIQPECLSSRGSFANRLGRTRHRTIELFELGATSETPHLQRGALDLYPNPLDRSPEESSSLLIWLRRVPDAADEKGMLSIFDRGARP